MTKEFYTEHGERVRSYSSKKVSGGTPRSRENQIQDARPLPGCNRSGRIGKQFFMDGKYLSELKFNREVRNSQIKRGENPDLA